MAGPEVTSYSNNADDIPNKPIEHNAQDSAGNKMYAHVSNPSGYVNKAEVTCADGRVLDVRDDVKSLLTQIQEAAPSSFLGITVSEGGPSPIAPFCAPGGSTVKTR